MDYEGPDAADIRNIRALNRAWLDVMRPVRGPGSEPGRTLADLHLQRLCMAPFLLFSLREQDAGYWEQLLADKPQADLLEDANLPDPASRELQLAALSFLWQLSRQRPYVARLVSGAPAGWCEQIASMTLVQLLRLAANRGDLLVPRFPDGDRVSDRLLRAGMSAKRQLQEMSQQFALQAMLTRGQSLSPERLPAAACSFPAPARRVAERAGVRARDTKV